MSKAFVIKVKENCYWLGGFYGKNNYGDIAYAKVYVNKTQAEKQCKLVNEIYGHNTKVVEITIAEGDLEQSIRKQVCDEIRSLAHNYFELVICDKCGNPIDDDCYMSSKAFCGILKQVEKGEK